MCIRDRAYSARQVTEVFDGQGNMAAIEIPGMSRLSSLPRDVSDCVLQQMHPKTSYLRVTRAPDGGYLVQCNNLTQGPQRFTFAFDAEGKRLP